MTVQHTLKAILYGAVGFAFWQWLPLVMSMIMSGAIGTWLGLKLLHRISSDKFKQIFRLVLTLLSLQLAWQESILCLLSYLLIVRRVVCHH